MMNDLIQINPSKVTGKKYWRSLEQLADTPEFRKWAEREFPEGAAEFEDGGSRRTILKLMAAGFGLAGLTACRRPVDHIMPFSKGVENYIHGKPMHYATLATVGGAATGLIVKTNEGRPTKVEGNPRHPFSLGATNAQTQGLLLNLYDPDRAKEVHNGSRTATWDEFTGWLNAELAKAGDGAGLRILAERSSSPTLGLQKAEILKKYPKAQWVEYDSVSFDQQRLGAQMAFGQPLEPLYRFDQAAVIFSLDSDFLGLDSQTILPVKQFSAGRRVQKPGDEMNRLYVAESNFTITGAMADHRLRVRSSDVGALALALAKELNVSGAELKVLGGQGGSSSKFIAAAAKDLAAHKGKSIVIAGPRQPAAVHAVVALINQALGNNGQTVSYTKPVVEATDSLAAVKQLAADMNSGVVRTLVVLGGNPAYSLPADLGFAAAMKKVPGTVALTADENETWELAEWRLPEKHPFESWGDARALDGTASIQQPLILPLYRGMSVLEIAAMISGTNASAHDLVRKTWLSQWPAAEAEKRWRQALYDGLIEGTRNPVVDVKADAAKVLPVAQAALKPAAAGLEVVFYPSGSSYDGRFANNAWLQETPEAMTKIVWDNAALISPATAKSLGVASGAILEISANGLKTRMPALILPGHADNSISLSLGYGRSACGRVGQGVGHRAEALRSSSGFFIAAAQVSPMSGSYELVSTQEHNTLIEPITDKKRTGIILEGALEEYRKEPAMFHEEELHLPQHVGLFPAFDFSKGNQWGMAIDLNACIGCNACQVACQAENNIPVVGKEQVKRGREMAWIRMDRYFTGDQEDPQAVMQPMACQQCENAPCESVCPVAATVHSPEGLNEMTYNRCVGTRYCSNNCPYKVRRFNFFNYHKEIQDTHKMVFNPDVTVRMRGVMEKCTYCVQRIQETKITAKAEGHRTIKDGEIVSACQQVCPADAIVFGNILDPESRVAKLKKQDRNYTVLNELDIKPRTSYLARLRNPNPELA
jgi:MoCo/4Fe-4S cofactor protein with predicted Tat translocation signal